jgi:hypothetical protein
MDSVKRAQKTMLVLAIIPGCLCVAGLVAYFATGKGDVLGILGGWTTFSALIVSQAQAAIKTLEHEIESLQSGSSGQPAAAEVVRDEPSDE